MMQASAGGQGAGYAGRGEPLSGCYDGRLNPIPTGDGYHGICSSYSSVFPRDDLTRCNSYLNDPLRRCDSGYSFGAPAEYMGDPRDARAAYRPPVGENCHCSVTLRRSFSLLI